MSAPSAAAEETTAPANAATRHAVPAEILLIRVVNIKEPFAREWIEHIETRVSTDGQEFLRFKKAQGPRLHEREPRTGCSPPPVRPTTDHG
ncbi:hypothetical protein GCM10025786_16710 [Nocardioides caeni]